MSDQWTSKFAIMRDLSLAQGFDVPATLNATFGGNEKPPAPNITEETAEQYSDQFHDTGDASVGPDLPFIKQMLEMVKGTDSSSDYDKDSDKVIEIFKPYENGIDTTGKANRIAPISPKNVLPNAAHNFVASNNNNIICVLKKNAKKKRENVAVNSLLDAMASNIPILNMEKPDEPMKLLKPTDFMSTKMDIVESVEKVNGWLNAQEDQASNRNTKPYNRFLNFKPSSMFKRKSGSTIKSSDSDIVKTTPPQKDATTTTASFQPSNVANQYYLRYLEKSKVKESIIEDVWTQAERIMKEIDGKKKALKEENAISKETFELTKSSEETNDIAETVKSPEVIQLPQHRHLLTGDCVVCKVVRDHGFHVDM